jgi:hypothetical protein
MCRVRGVGSQYDDITTKLVTVTVACSDGRWKVVDATENQTSDFTMTATSSEHGDAPKAERNIAESDVLDTAMDAAQSP